MPMFTEEAWYVPAAHEVQSRLPANVDWDVGENEYAEAGMYSGV